MYKTCIAEIMVFPVNKPNNIIAISVKLLDKLYKILLITLSYILLPSFTAVVIVVKLSSSKITSATPLVTSVPLLPIPTPTFASLIAGASFTPSPVIATTLPVFCSAFTSCNLLSGLTLAKTEYLFAYFTNSFSLKLFNSDALMPSLLLVQIPISLATESAVGKLSPVTIIGLILASKHVLIASLTLGLTGSFKPTKPTSTKSFSSLKYSSSFLYFLSIFL